MHQANYQTDERNTKLMTDTVLVIDDDSDILTLIQLHLIDAGFNVLLASNGNEGIKIAESALPNLILSDIIMPQMDGFETCRQLKSRKKTKDIPVIFMTAHTGSNEVTGFEMGAEDYVTKPIQFEEVLARITSHIKLHKLQNALKKNIQQLKKQQKDLLSILNQLEVGTVIIDAKERIVFISESCAYLSSKPLSNMIGSKWKDVLPFEPESRKQLRQMIKLPSKERVRISMTCETAGGQRHWLECDIREDPQESQRHILYLYNVSEVYKLRDQLDKTHYFGQMVGNSKPMLQMYEIFEKVAQGDWTVMIEGETGVGKELVARGIHAASSRQHKPFIAVNCAGLSESLLASQLFGHRRGAFTGAITDQQGFFEAADGGTLFLDEIGDIPSSMQTSLLRVLQEKEIIRVGDSIPRKIDVRILTATHKNLDEEIAQGRFRQDLFYRLRIGRIKIPALRERREDIPLLVSAFLAESRVSTGKSVTQVSVKAMHYLQGYHWPGNVRELKNTIEYALIHCQKSVIQPENLPPEIQLIFSNISEPTEIKPEKLLQTIDIEIEEDEKTHLYNALKEARGNRSRAAELLDISRATLYRRLAKFGDKK
jgi:DNA-binding NtrC family response regulator